MGSNNVNTALIEQEITNNLLQDVNIKCQANCENISSGNVYTFVGGTFGSIEFTQRCEAEANCVITNTQDLAVESIVESVIRQEALSSGLAGRIYAGNTNLTDIKQDIRNNIQQLTDIQCNSDVSNISTGNVFYLQDVTATKFAVTQEGNAAASCAIENLAKLSVINRAKADVDQKAVDRGFDPFGFIALIVIAIIVVLGIILFFVLRPKGTPAAKPAQGTTATKTSGTSGAKSAGTKMSAGVSAPKPPPKPTK